MQKSFLQFLALTQKENKLILKKRQTFWSESLNRKNDVLKNLEFINKSIDHIYFYDDNFWQLMQYSKKEVFLFKNFKSFNKKSQYSRFPLTYLHESNLSSLEHRYDYPRFKVMSLARAIQLLYLVSHKKDYFKIEKNTKTLIPFTEDELYDIFKYHIEYLLIGDFITRRAWLAFLKNDTSLNSKETTDKDIDDGIRQLCQELLENNKKLAEKNLKKEQK